MTEADISAAGNAQVAAFDALHRAERGDPPQERDDRFWDRVAGRFRHFMTNDPDGTLVAVVDGTVIGCALALKRESYWGLSLLAVDPSAQGTGAGRRLLDTALRYAEGCERAVIMSSTDPRAIRSYATSGFTLHPQVWAVGEPDRSSLPATNPRVRAGSASDIELADSVDRLVRGAARGPDQVRMAAELPEITMYVVDDPDGRGYVYVRSDGEIYCLAATDEETASRLLWRGFAHAADAGKPVDLYALPAEQQWAIKASLEARLTVKPGGPVFWRGGSPPPAYLPSGAFL